MASKKKDEKITSEGIEALVDLLNLKKSYSDSLKEIESKIKGLASLACNDYDGQDVQTKSGKKLHFQIVSRITPKYKEIAFELAKGHEERIQEMTDNEPERFLTHSTSCQVRFAKETENEE